MKGYKAFNKGWVCRDFQYEIGKTYELLEGQELKICENGFHFCKNPIDVFGYYPMNDETLIAEVEALGDIEQEGTKYCTNKIRIVKEFTRKQLQAFILDRRNNTGNRNTGNCNTGNCNTGDYNTGDCNSGVCNAGNRNTGNWNSGNFNTGNFNTGDYNTGGCNSGDCNTGNCNIGNRNSGDCNTGNRNSGDWNSGNRNTGIFNSDEPNMRAFNKECDITFSEFLCSIDYDWCSFINRIFGNTLYNDDYDRIRALPNFNSDIFKEITGIDVCEKGE